MKIAFPAIKSEKPKAYVVDTPGSNEVGELELQQIADIMLKTASAYVYVMTYNDIKNKEDYQALRSIYERDEGIRKPLSSFTFFLLRQVFLNIGTINRILNLHVSFFIL